MCACARANSDITQEPLIWSATKNLKREAVERYSRETRAQQSCRILTILTRADPGRLAHFLSHDELGEYSCLILVGDVHDSPIVRQYYGDTLPLLHTYNFYFVYTNLHGTAVK